MARWWRARVRPNWRAARPIIVIGLGFSAIILGTIGYSRLPGTDYDFLDSLYRAIGLFGLGGAVDPPVPLSLQIARVVAPLLTGYAAIRGLIALSRDQIQLGRIRLTARDHVVVAGLGEVGSRLARAYEAAGERVVVMERDVAAPYAEGLRERGVTVIPGNAADPDVLGRTGARRARLLFLCMGDDGVNVDAAAAASAVVRGRTSGVLSAYVHLDDLELLRALSAEAVASGRHPALRLEFFNAFATAARLVIEHRPPFPPRGEEPRNPHVLVVGLESVGRQLIRQLVNAWHASDPGPGERLRITLAGPDADRDVAALLDRHPRLARLCSLEARPMDLESADFRRGGAMTGELGACDVDFAYVCFWDESKGMAAALSLRSRPDTRDVPIMVAVADETAGVGTALQPEEGRLMGVEPFGVFSSAASPEMLEGGMTELIARAKHDEYLRHAPPDDPSAKPWDELPESLRESNRRFADGVGRKLELSGCGLVPGRLMDGDQTFAFGDDEIEDLAREEHDRWVADLLADGWRATTGSKDPERKLHPLLVPWEELPESEREKDRAPVRELPAILERAGLRIYRVTDA